MQRILESRQDGLSYLVGLPSEPLNLWVDHFLIARGWPRFSERRVFPNNHVDIFFNLGDRNRGKLEQQPEGFDFNDCIVSGLRTSYLEIRPQAYFEVAGIRFTLFGFYDLFGIPACDLADDNVTQFDVIGREAREIYGRLMDCSTIRGKFALLEQWMQSRASRRPPDIRKWMLVEGVLRRSPDPVQSSLAPLMGYSHKHVIALFRERAGLTPKEVQRIYRVNNVIKALSAPDCPDLSILAARLCFSDQSHMTRELKQYTGFTPLEFQRQQRVSNDRILRLVR